MGTRISATIGLSLSCCSVSILATAIGLAEPGRATPDPQTQQLNQQQQVDQFAQWRRELRLAFCARDWTEAYSVAGAMMGSDVATNEERLWLYALRQDISNYHDGYATFTGCTGSLDAGASVAGVAYQPLSPSTGFSWARGLAAVGIEDEDSLWGPIATDTWPGIFAEYGLDPSAAAAPFPEETPLAFTEEPSSPISTQCAPVDATDRLVGNGSIRRRWNYEIWQTSFGDYYTQSWQQSQTCAAADISDLYDTPDAVMEELHDRVETDHQFIDNLSN